MRSKIYLVLAIGLISIFFCGCKVLEQALSLEKPSARITGLNFGQSDAESVTLIFDVEVSNPYPVDMPLTNLVYNITSNGSKFLSGNTALQTTIAAKNKTAVSLPVKMNYLEAFNAIKGIKPGTTINYKADATLTTAAATLGKFDIPLAKEGQMEIPEITGGGVIKLLNKIKTK